MRNTMILMLLAALCCSPDSATAAEQASGVRGEVQFSMNDAGVKLIELADAVPRGKYTWRPARNVRSTAEVFLHVVQVNYLLPMLLGAKPPLPIEELKVIDRSTTDKARITQLLKDSYAFANQAILGLSDADLDSEIELNGHKMSKRAALLVLASHAHEHLGQSIAYARMNGVTPPWTAREAAEVAKQAAEKKGTTGGR